MELDPLGEDTAASLREIVRAGRHLQALLDEALDLTRIEQGRVELHCEPVNLHAVLLECFSLTELDAAGHAVSLGAPPEACTSLWVMADRRRLSQILLNLLSNGIKYNRPGGRVDVHCRCHRDGRAEIVITDTGVGIPEARQSELFQAFNRLDQEGGFIEGTGLGLAISKHLVELMGGGIQVTSAQGKGSSFSLFLPLAGDSGTALVHQPSGTREKHGDQAGRRHKVLYVEDNPANLRLVEALLSRREDLEFLGVQEPGECLSLARRARPDLIMLDINLPGTSGYALLEGLRQTPGFEHTPIIAVSANAMPFEVERGLEAGFARYLTKPLDIGLFMETLDELLEAPDEG
ncbi:hybrid sensor histidine kinase/response regulator [Thioalkalivibrio sulfidiphilus]|uniref:hybrid sensor histidine kinase/response regulator n=1 Tax=Thioalkalivibrio sulfidiphilus TaxID=1033854 RepID=UPI003B352445